MKTSWADWCDSAFRIGYSTFPSDADDPQPTVAFSDGLFSDEGLADMPVWVHEELPILALRVFTDVGLPVVPPVIDQPVQRIMDGLICKDKRMDEVSVFSWPICDPLIHIGTWDTQYIGYLHRPNAFGFWQTRLHLCYKTLKRISKRVWHEPKLHISRLPLFANFDL